MAYSEFDEFKNKFIPKRKNALLLADSFDRLGLELRAERCRCCGSMLEFAHSIDADGVVSDESRLHKANFCRDRLCPMCTWRRSLKIFGQVSKVLEYVNWDKYKAVFVTLTIKNCPLNALKDTIDRIYKAFSRMVQDRRFKESFPGGYFRVLEVTLGKDKKSWHPHLHIIFLAKKSYGPRSVVYLKQKDLSEIWDFYVCSTVIPFKVLPKNRTCDNCLLADNCELHKNTDYNGYETHIELDDNCGWRDVKESCKHFTPKNRIDKIDPGAAKIVYIELVKAKDDDKDATMMLKKAILETSKYMCKDSDYIIPDNPDLTDKLVNSLISGIGGRRLIQYGGMLAKIHAMLELDDAEDGNLVHVNDDELPFGDVALLVIRYGWKAGAYIDLEHVVKDINVSKATSAKTISKRMRKFYKNLEKLKDDDTIRYANVT